MKTAVIALTKNGELLSRKIAESLAADRFVFEKYASESARPFASLASLTAEIFGKYDGLVFVCAAGIAVRAVAPLLRSKLTDPAVVAADEGGRFAVSLVSGHVGGANALAEGVAAAVGALPVITTATDVGGKFSPDSFAAANALHILEPELAKKAAAAVLNGEKLGFESDFPFSDPAPELAEGGETGILVSADSSRRPFKYTLHLVPKNIVLGVGCRKGLEPEVFEAFVLDGLKCKGIPLYRVCEVRTIDRKRGETAILRFCEKHALPLRLFTAEELAAVEGEFSGSSFVLETVGVDNVCERAAAFGGCRLTVGKLTGAGATLAVGEEAVTLDFERRPSW